MLAEVSIGLRWLIGVWACLWMVWAGLDMRQAAQESAERWVAPVVAQQCTPEPAVATPQPGEAAQECDWALSIAPPVLVAAALVAPARLDQGLRQFDPTPPLPPPRLQA